MFVCTKKVSVLPGFEAPCSPASRARILASAVSLVSELPTTSLRSALMITHGAGSPWNFYVFLIFDPVRHASLLDIDI
jgi:hypothetical protein